MALLAGDERRLRMAEAKLLGYDSRMERVFRKFESFEEQEAHEISEYINLSIDQRQKIARKLKERFYGQQLVDVREFHSNT